MSTTEQSSDFDGSMYYVLLILLLCTLLMGPCVFFPRQRIICFRRIRQRRWNVATDDIAHSSTLDGEIRQRADDSSYVVATSKEDAEKINMEYLLEQLKDYTKTIEDTDFVSVVDEDDCAYADLATAGKNISTEGNNGTVDIDITLSNPQDSIFRDDVEEGLGNETEKEQTDIADTTFTSTTKIEEKDDETTIRLLQLPFPGSKAPVEVSNNFIGSPAAVDTDDLRTISPECAVCLNEFIVGERISWSSGNNCDHIFHEDCILRWFLTLRRRADAKRRKRKCDVECKLHCPMCRQDFIASPNALFSDIEDNSGDTGEDAV
mmetsp:Transcript_3843/g.5863  ORF Transcript_3843/g.5863 Transcript_3843/m.5863 type:complete len:320 (+) Transcript_3843:76-1035(+)